jgi:hypothetical protein
MVLVAPVIAVGNNRLFYYGNVADVDIPAGILSVTGDDNATWQFRITSSTQVEKDVENPTAGTLQDLKVGARVRVFTGSERSSAPVREALRILIYGVR